MGTIRTLLALGVLIGHAKADFLLPLPGGMMAVQAFYIISGFYMGLVLTEKYSKKENSYSLFITNRFLRVFPVYWAVLFAALSISLLSWQISGNPLVLKAFVDQPIEGFAFFYAVLVNIVVMGQDVLMFIGLDQLNNAFFFTPDFNATDPKMHSYLLVQPSWTIALEFTFYAVAPLLNRLKTKWLVVLLSLGFSARFTMYLNGFYNDPWYYRFFPFELSFFVLGILAYRWYLYKRHIFDDAKIGNLTYAFFFMFLLTTSFLPGPYMVKCYLLYLLLFTALPFIFSRTKQNGIDRSIGELSYPLYICHYPLLELLNMIEIGFIGHNNKAYILVLLSIFAAISINYFLARYIENLRQMRVKNAVINQ